ncbi:hypothetical protein HDV06_003946, partial [Boothiomyces sp. JEL0866]
IDDVGASETFTLANGQTLVQYVKQNTWIGLVSFWSLNRDNAASTQQNQTPYQYSQIFLALNA